MANLTRYNPFNEVISLRDAVEITAQQDTLSLKWETKTTVPEGAHGEGCGEEVTSYHP